MTAIDLEAFFGDGWSGHDVEGAAGTDVCGTRHVGRERVRAAFARVFATFPDVAFRDLRHVVTGERGISEWTFVGTTPEGKKIEVNGCDLFTFRDGKIALKSSYLKNRSVTPPERQDFRRWRRSASRRSSHSVPTEAIHDIAASSGAGVSR